MVTDVLAPGEQTRFSRLAWANLYPVAPNDIKGNPGGALKAGQTRPLPRHSSTQRSSRSSRGWCWSSVGRMLAVRRAAGARRVDTRPHFLTVAEEAPLAQRRLLQAHPSNDRPAPSRPDARRDPSGGTQAASRRPSARWDGRRASGHRRATRRRSRSPRSSSTATPTRTRAITRRTILSRSSWEERRAIAGTSGRSLTRSPSLGGRVELKGRGQRDEDWFSTPLNVRTRERKRRGLGEARVEQSSRDRRKLLHDKAREELAAKVLISDVLRDARRDRPLRSRLVDEVHVLDRMPSS